MRPFEQVCYELREIYSRALGETNRERYDSELWRYNGHLATAKGSRTRVQFTYDLCRLAHFDPEGKVILDAGCGFGAVSIILKLMGAKQVHGIDVYAPRLTTFQKMIEDFHLDSLEARLGSVENMPYPSDFFDMVLSNEAISHYNDVDGFLREAARVLKRGGTLIIADGNNGANPRIREQTLRLWERCENGPPGEVDGHQIRTTYLQMRKQIIGAAAPDLDEHTVEQLARGTSGLAQDEILKLIVHYRETGELPRFFYQFGECPRNPETGAVMERLFHPRDLATHVENFGFKARYYAYFGGASSNRLIRLINAVGMKFSSLTIRWARGFRIVAQKL